MKRIRAFKNIWSVSRKMPVGPKFFRFSLSYTFIAALVVSFAFMITIGKYIPLPSVFDNWAIRYIALPILSAWLLDTRTIDDKKPLSYVKTMLAYTFRHKHTVMGRNVNMRNHRVGRERITTVTDIWAVEEKGREGRMNAKKRAAN